MSDMSFDEFEKNVLIPYFKNSKYYDQDALCEIIAVKKNKFENKLDSNQKEEFSELWKLFDHYCNVVKYDSLTEGYFSSLHREDIIKENADFL